MIYVVGELVNREAFCEGEFENMYQNYKDTSPWPNNFVLTYLLGRNSRHINTVIVTFIRANTGDDLNDRQQRTGRSVATGTNWHHMATYCPGYFTGTNAFHPGDMPTRWVLSPCHVPGTQRLRKLPKVIQTILSRTGSRVCSEPVCKRWLPYNC